MDSLRIGEVAAVCGVSADTIRHYERKNLLPLIERSAGGYRMYSQEAVKRIRIVRRALAIGFSLDELSEAFGQRSRGSMPCRRVHSMGKAKLSALDTKIEELLAARAALAARLDEWEQRLENEGNRPAHLLHSLID